MTVETFFVLAKVFWWVIGLVGNGFFNGFNGWVVGGGLGLFGDLRNRVFRKNPVSGGWWDWLWRDRSFFFFPTSANDSRRFEKPGFSQKPGFWWVMGLVETLLRRYPTFAIYTNWHKDRLGAIIHRDCQILRFLRALILKCDRHF